MTEEPDICGADALPLAAPRSLGLHVPLARGVLDAGRPEADLDDDGFRESVTLSDERGLTVLTDTDVDGTVDHVSTVRYDGTHDSWELRNATHGVPYGGFVNGAVPTRHEAARWVCTTRG